MQLEIRSCSKGGKLYHALVNQARARGEGAPPRIGSRERARTRALQVSDQVAKAHSIRSQSWCATEPLWALLRALC